jgi:menaquinone-specific isochorismate synthase
VKNGLSKTRLNLAEACHAILIDLNQKKREQNKHDTWQYELSSFNERQFFQVARGIERISFISRDREYLIFGLGAADRIRVDNSKDDDGLVRVIKKTSSLLEHQNYFAAIRFDSLAKQSHEWANLGQSFFILPLLSVIIKKQQILLSLNFRNDAHISWPVFLDHAKSLLLALADSHVKPEQKIEIVMGEYLPNKRKYCENVIKALADFCCEEHKKVVIARRRLVEIKNIIDPAELYFRLRKKSKNAFLFFLDDGKSTVFFGASPELLYRRCKQNFATESLAGTRSRAKDEVEDVKLREALLNSLKDKSEHSLVSMHIEQKLSELGVFDLFISDLEIMALSYVQHLLKRYCGKINEDINDIHILDLFHPTPAVCGLDKHWALQFIRAHEGFDRGFYAGPIGLIGKDEAEFAVAIRSALYHRQQLFLYTACGIVPGSAPWEEWEELNNKEKNILSIFDNR